MYSTRLCNCTCSCTCTWPILALALSHNCTWLIILLASLLAVVCHDFGGTDLRRMVCCLHVCNAWLCSTVLVVMSTQWVPAPQLCVATLLDREADIRWCTVALLIVYTWAIYQHVIAFASSSLLSLTFSWAVSSYHRYFGRRNSDPHQSALRFNIVLNGHEWVKGTLLVCKHEYVYPWLKPNH